MNEWVLLEEFKFYCGVNGQLLVDFVQNDLLFPLVTEPYCS